MQMGINTKSNQWSGKCCSQWPNFDSNV